MFTLTLSVTADEMLVLCECRVTLLDARAHAGAGDVGLLGLLGELQDGTAAVADGEAGSLALLLEAGQQLVLEVRLVHVVDEVFGTRAELDVTLGLAGAGSSRSSGRSSTGNLGYGQQASSHSRGTEQHD